MQHSLKTISVFASILAITAVIGGCSNSRSERKSNENFVQTHQNDDVTRIEATMYQRRGDEAKMGRIRFRERDSGLSMTVNLRGLQPNTEYRLAVYDILACGIVDHEKSGETMVCEKERQNISLPTFRSDAEGSVRNSFTITGTTAAEMNRMKLSLIRRNDNGQRVEAGWGILEESGWF